MSVIPNEALLRSELKDSLQENMDTLCKLMNLPDNKDVVVRELRIGDVDACLVFTDGMAGNQIINESVLYPLRVFSGQMPVNGSERASYLVKNVLAVGDTDLESRNSELVIAVLNGLSVLIIDGCPDAVVMETRFFERRVVGRPNGESVVIGAQQGFVENLRTNITLIRRIVRSPSLMSEMSTVGKLLPTNLSIMYLKGAANEQVLQEVRRRIQALDVDSVPDSGHLIQLIEERRFTLMPQVLETERPDRAAYLIAEGRIAIMVDNSPYAMIVPVSFFDFMQTADDMFMRWQYASFNRVVRFLGMLISLILPSLYVATTLYHSQMIPVELLSSIAETRAEVPFPVLIELLIMEVSFYLINEAGTRMPTQIGSALGIVGALILGQAAVAASILSPILIIIAALTGLGNYTIPDYRMGIAIQLLRIGLLLAGSILGLYGIILALFLYVCALCSIQSFGQPYMAPLAPWRPHDSNVFVRGASWRQNRMPFIVNENAWLKRTPEGEKTRVWEAKRK